MYLQRGNYLPGRCRRYVCSKSSCYSLFVPLLAYMCMYMHVDAIYLPLMGMRVLLLCSVFLCLYSLASPCHNMQDTKVPKRLKVKCSGWFYQGHWCHCLTCLSCAVSHLTGWGVYSFDHTWMHVPFIKLL